MTELVGLCLWDTFSDNHDVIATDGRVADIGSFRGAGAFLDEHLTRDQEGWRNGDYMRFYMRTIWISRRADLTPVYAMINTQTASWQLTNDPSTWQQMRERWRVFQGCAVHC